MGKYKCTRGLSVPRAEFMLTLDCAVMHTVKTSSAAADNESCELFCPMAVFLIYAPARSFSGEGSLPEVMFHSYQFYSEEALVKGSEELSC